MVIKDPITITVNNSYDIDVWYKAIIERCMIDNPSSTLTELAKLLNVSERTLYRRCDMFKIPKGWEKIPGKESYISNPLNIHQNKNTNVAQQHK